MYIRITIYNIHTFSKSALSKQRSWLSGKAILTEIGLDTMAIRARISNNFEFETKAESLKSKSVSIVFQKAEINTILLNSFISGLNAELRTRTADVVNKGHTPTFFEITGMIG